MEPFTKRVVEMIKDIPVGKVMSYGQIARLAGNPRGARQVARILHSMGRKYNLPWHRVINAKGEISMKDHEGYISQKAFLENEGIEFINGKSINLNRYQFHPD